MLRNDWLYNGISFPDVDKQNIQAGIIKISVIKESPEDVLQGPGPVRITFQLSPMVYTRVITW